MVYCNINSPDEENNTNFSNEVKRLKHKIAQVSQIRLRISHIFVTGGVMNENKFYIILIAILLTLIEIGYLLYVFLH